MVTSSVTGVIEVEPPEVFTVAEVAVKAELAVCWAPDSIVMLTVISAGVLIVLVTVQVAFTVDVLYALQKPVVLALDAGACMVSARTESKMCRVGSIAARHTT